MLNFRDVPGGPGVRTPRFHLRGRGFDPGSGNKDPASCMVSPLQKKDAPRRQNCRRCISRLTVSGCLLTDRLTPLPSFVPIRKKPSDLNTVSGVWLKISEDLEVILTSNWKLVTETKIRTCLSREGTSSFIFSPPLTGYNLSFRLKLGGWRTQALLLVASGAPETILRSGWAGQGPTTVLPNHLMPWILQFKWNASHPTSFF